MDGAGGEFPPIPSLLLPPNNMQVDIQDAYRFTTIDGNYGLRNVTDKDDIPDLEAPTECEDEEKVSELKAVQVKYN